MTLTPCKVCEAPCRDGHELHTHEASCVAIVAGAATVLTPLDAEALQNYCFRIHCEDQAATNLRQNVEQDTHLPDRPPHPPSNPWARFSRGGGYGQTFPIPEGKTLCASCNGITHMYPDCVACDGKGYV